MWSYDLVAERTSDGIPLRMLAIVDEHKRECLAIRINRQITAPDVIEQLWELFLMSGTPDHIRSDNGSEFTCDRFTAGSTAWVSERFSSSREAHGRTAILNHSTGSFAMNS